MAKKKAKPDPERYEYVRAVVDADGELRWVWKLPGKIEGGMSHDDNVGNWSDADIQEMTRQMLDMGPDEKVEVEHE